LSRALVGGSFGWLGFSSNIFKFLSTYKFSKSIKINCFPELLDLIFTFLKEEVFYYAS
jgi:hypothetical protein